MKKLYAILMLAILTGCGFSTPKPEDCKIKTVTINNVAESNSQDIVFFSNSGNRFYISKGMELGLNLDSLNAKVLNKTVTLHLPRVLGGLAVSEHIAQITVDDEILFTEFKD